MLGFGNTLSIIEDISGIIALSFDRQCFSSSYWGFLKYIMIVFEINRLCGKAVGRPLTYSYIGAVDLSDLTE